MNTGALLWNGVCWAVFLGGCLVGGTRVIERRAPHDWIVLGVGIFIVARRPGH